MELKALENIQHSKFLFKAIRSVICKDADFPFSLHLQQQMATTQNKGIKQVPKSKSYPWMKWAILAVICIVTFVSFRYTLDNLLTNWDDDVYVTHDKYIESFSRENLKAMLTEDITKNNYHPLTMLSLAMNYHFSQLEPHSYYLTNVLIHIANVILVFLLAMGLCKRLKFKDDRTLFIAAFCAILFGVHPMHVESVSWLAERKDVLYAFFYFLGLLSYLKYFDKNKTKWYLLTILCFLLSCLSKPMAVVFPGSLLAIDILLKRKWQWKVITDKIPFILIALLCGGYAVYRQNATGAIASFNALKFSERVMFASYGFVMYIYKLFNPTFLSTFYPYPAHYLDGSYKWIFYWAPFISVLIIAIPLFLTWKYNRKYFSVVAFGLGYFIANVIFILQFISCGTAIMADRYCYVAYFGLFFMLLYFISEISDKVPASKYTIIGVLSLISVELSYLCYERTKVWHNSETLYKDAIRKFPYQAWLSYKWLGNYYMDSARYNEAEKCFRVLTLTRAADPTDYDYLGTIMKYRNQYVKAMGAYDTSLHMGGNIYRTLLDRSTCFYDMGDSASALRDFVAAARLNPEAEKNYSDEGQREVQEGYFPDALARYSILLKFRPTNPYYYFFRGVSNYDLHKLKDAEVDFKQVLSFNNRVVSDPAAYNLSVVCDSLNEDSDAVKYALISEQLGHVLSPDYINNLRKKRRGK